ncbi:hypothetical protein BHE74_00025242 [Ensete ventricosum]|nr:hypothetical protein BHE74_00025242 [Ensete ventricosum]
MPVRPGNTFKISGFPFTSFLWSAQKRVLGLSLSTYESCTKTSTGWGRPIWLLQRSKCLVAIRECYSILDEHVLYASLSGQLLYDPYLNGFSVSIDALEAGLRFPLHPVI